MSFNNLIFTQITFKCSKNINSNPEILYFFDKSKSERQINDSIYHCNMIKANEYYKCSSENNDNIYFVCDGEQTIEFQLMSDFVNIIFIDNFICINIKNSDFFI